MTNKKARRQEILAELSRVSAEDRRRTSRALTDRLMAARMWQEAEVIAITVSQAIEWDTRALIEASWRAGKVVCAPRTERSTRSMTFYRIDSFDDLEARPPYGILEPNPQSAPAVPKETIDLMIVPGLLFSERGDRIGFGGGYYDRYLANFHGATATLIDERQLDNTITAEAHDIPVNYIFTPERVIDTAHVE